MAMNKVTLGNAIADCVLDPDAPAEMQAKIKKMWQDIAGEIITHISSNATITVAAGIPVSTAGSAVAQTGATTATGTATIM